MLRAAATRERKEEEKTLFVSLGIEGGFIATRSTRTFEVVEEILLGVGEV